MTVLSDVLATGLLAWFNSKARDLPWRRNRTPYRIWLAEIMLQQTQVATVIPYYERFLGLWPDFQALAEADEEKVLKAWEGLGYYSRARNLHRAAIMVAETFSGSLPADEHLIRSLPGVGEYTAGAIGSIAFNLPIAAVDGNVVRVFSRLKAVAWNLADPADRRLVRKQVEVILPTDRPGDFNEALMDLGATVCLPRNPACPACPLAQICKASMMGRIDEFPGRKPVRSVLTEEKIVLVLRLGDAFHVNRRPAKGMLAGLYEFDWLDVQLETIGQAIVPDAAQTIEQAIAPEAALTIEQAIAPEDRQTLEQAIAHRVAPEARVMRLPAYSHRFTHRIWNLTGFLVDLTDAISLLPKYSGENGRWVCADELASLPFPTALERYRQAVLTSD